MAGYDISSVRFFGSSQRDEDIGDVCGVGDYSPRRLLQEFLNCYRHASIGSCSNCTHLRSDPVSRSSNTTNRIRLARESMTSPECCQFLNCCLDSGGVDLVEDSNEFGIRHLWFKKVTRTWWPDIERGGDRYKL